MIEGVAGARAGGCPRSSLGISSLASDWRFIAIGCQSLSPPFVLTVVGDLIGKAHLQPGCRNENVTQRDLHSLGLVELLVRDGFIAVGTDPTDANFATEAMTVLTVLNSNCSGFTLWTLVNC